MVPGFTAKPLNGQINLTGKIPGDGERGNEMIENINQQEKGGIMELQLTVNTDDMFDDEGDPVRSLETLLTDALRREIVKKVKDDVASDKFSEFSKLVSDEVTAGVKTRLCNFLNEEIALTDRWGEKDFVGSIEDLIKARFDDVLLRPVDEGGQTFKGCTSSTQTWIEWKIKSQLDETQKKLVKEASGQVEHEVSRAIKEKIEEMKNGAVKKQVNDAFGNIMQKTME